MRQPIQANPDPRPIEVMFVRGDFAWSTAVVAVDHAAAVHEAAHLLAYARYHELLDQLGRTTEDEWRVIRPDGRGHPIPPVRTRSSSRQHRGGDR
jgi:hypothetical protein